MRLKDGEEYIKVSVNITKGRHAEIADALGVEETYRRKIVYFIQDAIRHELERVAVKKAQNAAKTNPKSPLGGQQAANSAGSESESF